jgi:hypothetical protein
MVTNQDKSSAHPSVDPLASTSGTLARMSTQTSNKRASSPTDSDADSEGSASNCELELFTQQLEASIDVEKNTRPSATASPNGAELSDLQVMYNRRPYLVPKSAIHRDHGVPMVVKDGEKIGEMISTLNSAGKWPKASEVDLACIVVLSSKETDEEGKEETSFSWYTRIVTEENPKTDDDKILRHIPRPLARNILNFMQADTVMCKNDNFKPLQPKSMAGWRHCKTLPSSSSVVPPRKLRCAASTGKSKVPEELVPESENAADESTTGKDPGPSKPHSPTGLQDAGEKSVGACSRPKKRKSDDKSTKASKRCKKQDVLPQAKSPDAVEHATSTREMPDAQRTAPAEEAAKAENTVVVTVKRDEDEPTTQPVEAIYFFQSEDRDAPAPGHRPSNVNIPIPEWAVSWKIKLEATSAALS